MVCYYTWVWLWMWMGTAGVRLSSRVSPDAMHARTQPADRLRRVWAFLDAMAPVLPPPPPPPEEQENEDEEEEGDDGQQQEQLLSPPMSPAIVDGSGGGGGIPGEGLFAVPLGDMPVPAPL